MWKDSGVTVGSGGSIWRGGDKYELFYASFSQIEPSWTNSLSLCTFEPIHCYKQKGEIGVRYHERNWAPVAVPSILTIKLQTRDTTK